MDGLHSPWGILGKIMNDRGLKRGEILWDDSWVNLLMENVDAPRYVKGKRPAPVAESSDDIKNILKNRR